MLTCMPPPPGNGADPVVAVAVKSVIKNRGKRTAGIDGAKWTTPKGTM